MKNRLLSALGAFGLFVLAFLPVTTRAAETFEATVKIVGYHALLNGQLMPINEGSGTLISEDGEVLTNAHVIMDEELNRPLDAFSICLTTTPENPPECRFTATLEKYDEKIDLALLKADKSAAWGSPLNAFPHLTYQEDAKPELNDKVLVLGYPGTGGATINTTQGQVSGFEKINGFTYLKTDADIDAGNSGGTMVDEAGNLIGVPTFVISYLENSGRALHISEIKTWLEKEINTELDENEAAIEKLRQNLKRTHEANETKKISYDQAPGVSAQAPEGWVFEDTQDTSFTLVKEDNIEAYLTATFRSQLFKNDLTAEEKLALIRRFYTEELYPEDEVKTINGKEAIHLWSEDVEGNYHLYYLEHGYHGLVLEYYLPDADKEEAEKGVETLLKSLEFTTPDEDDKTPEQNLEVETYPFTLSVPLNWRIETDHTPDTNLALAGRLVEGVEGLMIYYGVVTQGETTTTPKEGLEYDLYNYVPYEATVTYESAELMIDGLPGWIIFYEYPQGDKLMKVASATILDPEYEFYFDFESEAQTFEEGLNGFIYTLKSFKSKRYEADGSNEIKAFMKDKKSGTYTIPVPSSNGQSLDPLSPPPTPSNIHLTDITGHRYEQSILNLVNMGVIHGNPNGTFDPEGIVNRAAALKIILESLRSMQEFRGEAPYQMPAGFNQFPDVTADLWYATYVAEAWSKGIVEGYTDGQFKGDQGVTLAEALKMSLVAYGLPIWTGETDPWHKKYMDAAYQNYLLPNGLTDPNEPLTRAELAYIVDQLVIYGGVDDY